MIEAQSLTKVYGGTVAELRDRAARLEAAEGERAARAVVEERLRIARELHDVIGHSISLIAIQAEAAARSARSNPDAVPAFLSRISAASRQALAEMRGVLAVLRPDATVLPDTVLPDTVLPDTVLPDTVLPEERDPAAGPRARPTGSSGCASG